MSNISSFINDDNIQYEYLSWAELGNITTRLATQILSDKRQFDRVIALATGGHTMSKAIKDYLDIQKISSLQISFYASIGKTKPAPIITQSVATNIEGESILLFDDVNDSGRTISVAKQYLSMRGVKNICVATLVSKSKTESPSDYSGYTSDNWIIFPDEVRETITSLSSKWKEQKLTPSEIQERLKQIGFSSSDLALIKEFK